MVNSHAIASRRPLIIPDVYLLLSGWRYLEHSVLRILAGWGRCAGDWEDKLAMPYHLWLQAEIVDRMRKRIDMYPGGKPDAPVHRAFEDLANAVLLAPSYPDAMAGVYDILNPALVSAYDHYIAGTHPVHDNPTRVLLREVLAKKAEQAHWYAGYSKRCPHRADHKYSETIRAKLAELGNLLRVIETADPPARSCGIGTDFQLDITPGRVKDWDQAPNLFPLLEVDWAHSVEARRLFFMIGYFWEMGVCEDQLRWVYHADFMPWEFIHAEARHLWDESRHGNSGLARLRDFGIDIADVGYSSYGKHGRGKLPPLTPADLYQEFYTITQLAETGYFETKRYCLQDFTDGRDEGSAEMMRFDIIDETSHVEYGRQWLQELATRAGVDEDYRKRGARDRAAAQRRSDQRVAAMKNYIAAGNPRAPLVIPKDDDSPDISVAPSVDTDSAAQGPTDNPLLDPKVRAHYQMLLGIVRDKCPLKNASAAPVRPNLPM